MFERTDHEAAPWHIVPADSKKYTRVTVIEQTIDAVEVAMRDHDIEPLDPDELGL
jgi:polyphosphate kinase 2 (PPK2 family)